MSHVVLRLAPLVGALLLGPTAVALAGPAAAGAKPPALLEPYAGYSLVFGPGSERVLGADANPLIERMLLGPFADCPVGDVAVQPRKILVQLKCPESVVDAVLSARGVAGAAPAGVLQPVEQPATFVLQLPDSPCGATCQPLRAARISALVAAVRKGESQLPWQRVLPPPGSPAGTWLQALMDAQVAVAIGDKPKATRLLAQAVAGRPVRDLQAQDALDLALLAGEAGAADIAKAATAQLQIALTSVPKTGGELLPLQMAAQALAGDVTAAANQAMAGGDSLDVVPVVRTLTAMRRFALAAQVLDASAIKQPSPRRDLLKLRFGIASAMNDAESEIRVGKLFIQLDPDMPDGYDILSAGLARQLRYREAIEVLYDLSKRNPERDIVLGRLAGLLNFLTDQAGRDPARAKDLEAVIAKMQLAATDGKDVVARFIVATRAYYAGKLEEALPQLESLLDSGNRDPRIPLYTAMAHFWLGHQEQAERLIARAVEIGPSDPDVFYCRSQIVRRKHLPQAIADLERYEQMTLQPWATGPSTKAQRVSAELKMMRQGRLPPDWDKPGPGRAVFLPEEQTGTELPAEVREGKLPLALDPSATALPEASSLANALASAGTATTGAVLTAPDPSTLPVTPLPPAEESSAQRWFPAALLAALAAAMGIRLWLKPGTKPKDDGQG